MDKKIAVIHKIKNDLKISEEEYRKILKESAGVISSKELDEIGYKKVIKAFMKSKYFQEKTGSITLKQKYYINSLFLKLKWDKTHTLNYIKKYFHVDGIEKMDKKTASKLIVALNNIIKKSAENYS